MNLALAVFGLILLLGGCDNYPDTTGAGDGPGTQHSGAGDGPGRDQSFFDEAEIRYYKSKHGIDTTKPANMEKSHE